MEFGIMFFASSSQTGADKYGLVKRAARFADERGFRAVWTPERHFHEFGGIFPNPSVLTAALAMITERIQLRGGSVVSPLHHAIRVAEEWSVADNLSNGRVAISFGSGWNVDDFVLFPDRYPVRREVMYEQIEEIRKLWRGESLQQTNGVGKPVDISLAPRPIQPQLPIWLSSSGSPVTFARAGQVRANVLTHLLDQDVAALAENIAVYRRAYENARGPEDGEGAGTVSVMLHTFVGHDLSAVRSLVRGPFKSYLRSAIKLETKSVRGGGAISGGKYVPSDEPIVENDLEHLLDLTVDRYLDSRALLGTVESCSDMVRRLEAAGVDEVACLIDFGVDSERVLAALEQLDELRASSAYAATAAPLAGMVS